MIKDLATLLKTRIADLPFIDKLAGLVQTIETQTKEDQPKTIRFPASVDINGLAIPLSSWNYSDLVPNSSKKSIIYFEDRGTKINGFGVRGIQATSTLRLVCWLNANLLTSSELAVAASLMKNLFVSRPVNHNGFLELRVTPESFHSQEENLFSKYTYDEKVRQYLMLPFHAFAINIKVDYTISENCL